MLTSLALVKQFINAPASDTSKDAWLTALKDAAEASVQSYCRRDFSPATYTEYYEGTGRKELVLRQRPVTSVTSVHVDHTGNYGDNPGGSFDSTTLLTLGVDYDVDYDSSYAGSRVSTSGVLVRLNAAWAERGRVYYNSQLTPEDARSYGSVKVVYSAGYDPVPLDVQYAVAFVVAYMKRTVLLGGELESEKIGDYAYTLHFPRFGNVPAEIGQARQLLSRYREAAF